MPRKRPHGHEQDPKDAEIRRLRDALYVARSTIVERVRPELKAFLDVDFAIESLPELAAWQRWAIAGVVAIADADPDLHRTGYDGELRHLCPLCGESPKGERGYTLTGLQRHLQPHASQPLLGWRCSVFGAANDLGRDHVARLADPNSPTINWEVKPAKPWLELPRRGPASVRGLGSVDGQGPNVHRPADQDSVVPAARHQVFDLEEARARRAQCRDADDHRLAGPGDDGPAHLQVGFAESDLRQDHDVVPGSLGARGVPVVLPPAEVERDAGLQQRRILTGLDDGVVKD